MTLLIIAGSSGITTDNSKETSFVEKTTQQIVSLVPNQVYTSPKVSDKTIPPLTDLSNFDHLYVPNVLSSGKRKKFCEEMNYYKYVS